MWAAELTEQKNTLQTLCESSQHDSVMVLSFVECGKVVQATDPGRTKKHVANTNVFSESCTAFPGQPHEADGNDRLGSLVAKGS
eukprot:7893884-Heterocapsa_arctica.AAC.1